jgi:predicted GNAT family acetyltransferase
MTRVVDNPGARRFEAYVDEALAGFAEYELHPDRIVFIHTEVDPAFEGRGVGSQLAAGALDAVRERGLRVIPRCPFIAGYLSRHQEYADLLRSH